MSLKKLKRKEAGGMVGMWAGKWEVCQVLLGHHTVIQETHEMFLPYINKITQKINRDRGMLGMWTCQLSLRKGTALEKCKGFRNILNSVPTFKVLEELHTSLQEVMSGCGCCKAFQANQEQLTQKYKHGYMRLRNISMVFISFHPSLVCII